MVSPKVRVAGSSPDGLFHLPAAVLQICTEHICGGILLGTAKHQLPGGAGVPEQAQTPTYRFCPTALTPTLRPCLGYLWHIRVPCPISFNLLSLLDSKLDSLHIPLLAHPLPSLASKAFPVILQGPHTFPQLPPCSLLPSLPVSFLLSLTFP